MVLDILKECITFICTGDAIQEEVLNSLLDQLKYFTLLGIFSVLSRKYTVGTPSALEMFSLHEGMLEDLGGASP